LRRGELPSAAALPAGSQIAVPNGQIAGALRLLSIDVRRMVATYELMVANQTHGPLAAFCYAVGAPQRGARLRWSSITVPPLSSVAVPVEIELPKRGPLRKIVAELHADGAQLIVDAAPPAIRRPIDPAAIAVAACGVGLVAVAAGAFGLARPRVAALAAPSHVKSGASFQVAYAFAPGTGGGDYALTGPDGRDVAHGTLTSQSGVITVRVPHAKTENRYDLHVRGRNALGVADDVAAVTASADAAPPKPRQAAQPTVHLPTVWLTQDTVPGGAPIDVRYVTDAETGTVKLIDQDGTERGSALISQRGSSVLIAPQVDSEEDFRIVVVARRGGAHVEAQVPVRVVRADGASGGTVPGVADASQTKPVTAVAGDPIALTSSTYGAGEGIVADVVHHLPNLRVVLLDESGQEVQRVDVAPEDDRVVLEAPRTGSDARYTVVATYGPGTSEESVIHSIVVKAR
jgi:hypothetical protein